MHGAAAGNMVLSSLGFKPTASKFEEKTWPEEFIAHVAKNVARDPLEKVAKKNLGKAWKGKSTKKDIVRDLLEYALGA